MKNLFRIAYLLLIAAISTVSCAPEEYTPGEPDLKDCHGVYFPTQTELSNLELSPEEPTEVTLKVMRLKEDGDITVPVIVTESEDGIFEVSDIKFEDGQTETTFTVSFPKAAIGVKYTCAVAVKDPQYALIYGANNTFISFSVTRIKWNRLEAKDGNPGKWRDDFISGLWVPAGFNEGGQYLEKDIEVYERDDRKGYYRIDNIYDEEYLTKMLVPDLKAAHISFENSLFIDATNPSKVTFDGIQYLGVEIEGYKARIIPYTKDYVNTDNDYYGTLVNGIITFPAEKLLLDADGDGLYYTNSSNMFRVILPGYKAYDYSVVLAAGQSSKGVLPIRFDLGDNISKVRYNVYEGTLTPDEITAKSLEIEKDENAEAVTESGVVGLTMNKTGVYTIVTANIDDQEQYQGANSEYIKYVAEGESVPVVLTSGLIVSDKYSAQGYTSENSVEFYVFGQDIATASMGLYTASAFASRPEAIIKELQDKALDGDAIRKINSTGYTGIIGDLNGGTDYILVILASNGYESSIFTANATTGGEFDPKKAIYTVADISPATSSSDYFKTWNNYAEDYFEPAGRSLVSIVTIEEGNDYPQQDGSTMDCIKVKGFFGNDAEALGFEDVMEFEYYNGFIYTLANVFGEVTFKGKKYYAGTIFLSDPENYTDMYDSALIGGFVDEGYLAFVDWGFGEEVNATFGPIGLCMFKDEEYESAIGSYSIYDKILLVDSDIDNAASTASAAKPSITRKDLKKISYEVSKSSNCVETPSGAVKSAIDRILAGKGIRDYYNVAKDVNVTYNAEPASFKVTCAVESVPSRNNTRIKADCSIIR